MRTSEPISTSGMKKKSKKQREPEKNQKKVGKLMKSFPSEGDQEEDSEGCPCVDSVDSEVGPEVATCQSSVKGTKEGSRQ